MPLFCILSCITMLCRSCRNDTIVSASVQLHFEVKIVEQARKKLKIWSLVVLLFAALTLLQIVAELMFGELNSIPIPAGAPENTLLITKVVLLVVSLVLLLPQVYVGLKGLKIAKTPKSSKGHIIWAYIMFALSALWLIDPVVGIVNRREVSGNISMLFSILLDLVIYYDYIKAAKEVAKLAE